MTDPHPSAPMRLQSVLPMPERGGSTRRQFGSHELVLERVRGGASLLWTDGREARRYALGVAAAGELRLDLQVPPWPLQVAVRETLCLGPGGRLRGYLHVPLVPVVQWWGTGAELPEPLLELRPRDLSAEWDEARGLVGRCSSPWYVRFPLPTGDLRVVVPVVLSNDAPAAHLPGELPLQLDPAEPESLRHSFVAQPRRLRWDGRQWRTGPVPAAEVQR